MDPDLSLLEISDEDDSLLLQIPIDDASILSSSSNNNNGNNNNYFLCSPLQIHGPKRSVHPPPEESKVGGENAENPCSSLLTDGINKQNINANKSEVPKLSMEPQQMKRRKNGGGYNLRKSLAWDRAFFTEKGVLDPVELSMISGGFSKVGEEMLPCIPEEGRESLSGVLDCTRDSADLQALEENLFKELSSSSMKKDRKRGGCLLPKHGSSARDNVSPATEAKAKVLSAHEINRSGSKRSACPRPVVSSSLKRPANLSTPKAANKVSKVSKIPVPKPDSSVLSRTTKGTSLNASGSKRSQIAQPGAPVNVSAENPCSSLLTDGINKENINANKSEVPKLSMEPQQMKRRKKGGGYNLRKSLAWDRAFFTEKGVLDPVELSMISGGFSKVGEEMLPCIPEEGRESLSGVLDCTRDSADLQVLEENLFMELSSSSMKKDRKRGGCLLPKHGSSARDNVSPAAEAKAKVLSGHEINRSGSKRSGCPRPVVSSSLKRPANLSTPKAANKVSKVSKTPVPKPDSSVLSRTTKGTSLNASGSKRNQIAQPGAPVNVQRKIEFSGAAVNVQRKIESKASSDNTRSAQKNSKAGPANKSSTVGTSVRQARRNVVSSASEKHPSTNLQCPSVTAATKGLEVIPDPLGPSTSHKPNSHDSGSNKIAVSLPQNACYAGGNVHHPQLQTAKLSGLRMPSPSLGFFGQPKASSLRSQLQRISQPHKFESNIPNFRKPHAINHIHDLRPPTHPGKIPNVVNDERTIGRNMEEVFCSSLEFSDPSTVNPTSHNRQDEKVKSVLKMNNKQKVEVKVPCQALKYQQQLHSIIDDVEQQVLEQAEPYKTEMISHSMDMELQKIDDKFPLQEGAPCGQLDKSDDNKVSDVCLRNRDLSETELENHPSISCHGPAVQDKDVSGTNDLVDHQTLEDQPYNLEIKNGGDFSGSNSGATCYNTWSTLKEKVPCQAVTNQQRLHSIIDNVDQPVLEWAEPYKTEMISHSEDIELQKIDDKFSLQEAPCGQLDKSVDNKKVADVCLRSRDSSGTELENHPSISCLSPAVQDKGVSGTNGLIDHQAVEDQPYNLALTNGGAFSGSNSGAASNNTWSTLKTNDDWLSSAHKVKEQSGEQAELMKPFTCKDDKMSSESQRLRANDASLLEDSGAPEESQKFSCMAGVSPKVQDCIETEVERSHGQSLYMYMKQAKGDGSKDDKTSRKLPMGDVQAEPLDGDRSDATGRSSPSTSTGDNQLVVVVDEDKRFGEELELHQSTESVKLEASDACESNSKSSGGLCLIPAAMQTCGHDMAKTVECQYAEDAPSISLDSEPVVENYNSSIDTQFRHDMELHGQVSSMELDMMVENHMPGNGCPKSGDYSTSELENPQTSPVLQIESGSGIDDVIQRENTEDKKCTLSTKNPHSIFEYQTGDDSGSSDLDTSIMHIDLLSSKHSTNEHSVERAKLILPCPFEADTMSYEENKSPETHHGLLFAKSQSFGGSMKLNSRTMADNSKVKGSGGSGLESPHGLSQHKHVDQATKEVGFNDMLEESHVVQSPDGSILVDSCNSDASILEVNNQCQMVVDDVNVQSGHLELPKSILVVERVFQQDDLLLANTTSGELNEENDIGVSEQSDAYGSESKSVELFSHVTPASQDNGLDADQESECLHMHDAVTGSVNLEPLVENPEHYSDEKLWHDNVLSGQASSLEAAKLSTDQISGAVANCNSKPFCSLNEESRLSAISVHASEREAETSISQSCEMQQDLDQATYATEDQDATVQLRKPEDDEKEETLLVKPPPHAVPFSDEWLAAFEAAGEEILTMKSGAVQNSPPDKCPHEPGPWSPVKKKNNQGIGPFDCTKYTNIPSSSSQ